MFPAPSGVSPTLNPVSLVTGAPAPDFNHMRLEFGSYVQLFDDASPTNTIRARTLGAISLTPTGNAQGDYYFLSLASGHRVSRHRWTSVPIPDTAIARVEALVYSENQPLIQDRGLVIKWRPNHPIDIDEYDRDFEPGDDPVDDVFPAFDYDVLDPAELADLHAAAVPLDALLPFDLATHGSSRSARTTTRRRCRTRTRPVEEVIDKDEYNEHKYEDNEPGEPEENPYYEEEYIEPENEDNEPDKIHGENKAEEGEKQGAHIEGAQHNGYNLRNRTNTTNVSFRAAMDKPFNSMSYFPPTQVVYKDIFANIMLTHQPATNSELELANALTQMSATASLKKHGRNAEEALFAEFTQLEGLNVYEPLDPSKLTCVQKREALRAINLVKEKRCGGLKGRTVADGRPERNMYEKSKTASPTVATDSLIMLSIIVDAHDEQRDVATADIPGAYLKADMKDFTIMKFTGASINILCEMNPVHVGREWHQGTIR